MRMQEFDARTGGRGRIDGLSLFPSVESRDAMLGGMDAGMDENFEPLDELIEAGDLAAATVS